MLQHSPSRLGKVKALVLVVVLTYWQKKRWRVLSSGQCCARLARAELVKVDTDTASLVRWRPPAVTSHEGCVVPTRAGNEGPRSFHNQEIKDKK